MESLSSQYNTKFQNQAEEVSLLRKLFNNKTEETASTDVRQMPQKLEVFLVWRSRLQNYAFIVFFIQIHSLSGAMATVSNESTSFTI